MRRSALARDEAAATLSIAPGSLNASAQVVPYVEAYDPDTDTWARKADFPIPAHHMNATVLDGSGTGTITDNDTVSISIGSVTVTEGNSGTLNAVFAVTSLGTVIAILLLLSGER